MLFCTYFLEPAFTGAPSTSTATVPVHVDVDELRGRGRASWTWTWTCFVDGDLNKAGSLLWRVFPADLAEIRRASGWPASRMEARHRS
jgi:hypothetical protein